MTGAEVARRLEVVWSDDQPGDDYRDTPVLEYCNTGDSYASTVVYRRDIDRIYIGTSWADQVETLERKGIRIR